MARVILVEALPWNPATGTAVPIRLAGGGRRHYTHKGVNDWLGGVVALPKVTTEIGFAAGGFTGGAIPQAAAIGFSPSRRETRARLARLMWAGAPVTVSVGDDDAAVPAWSVALSGTIAGYSIANGSFTFTMSDMAGNLAKAIAADSFTGGGGIEGPTEAAGRVKRRSWGQVFNVEGRILDSAAGIYEFGDPARPLKGFVAVKDRGRAGPTIDVAWAGSIAATFDALKAAAAPEGGAAIAPSIACVKWWTSLTAPAPLTADILGEIGAGYVETVPEIAARIVDTAAGPAVASVADLKALRPHVAGIHVDGAAESAANVLDRLLIGASLTWAVDPAGFTRLSPIAFADPVARLRVHAAEREAAYTPVTRVEVGYRRNHRQHSDAEISAAVLSDTIVMPDGSSIGTAITGAGQTAVWSQVAGYGRPVDFADVTAVNVASGFTGQGALATLNQLAYGSNYLTGFGSIAPLNQLAYGSSYLSGFGALAPLSSLMFGTPQLLESTGVSATLAAFKTIQGIASSITGQGAFATLNSAGYGSPLLTGFAALATLPNLFFGSNYLLEGSGGALASLANFKTVLGTASAITGQGSLATKSIIGTGELGDNVVTLAKLGAIGDVTNLAVNGRPTSASNWGGSSFIVDDAANAYGGARFVFKGEAGANNRYNANSNVIPLTPGEKLFMSWMGRVDAAITAGAARPYLRVNNKDGGQIGTPSVGQLQVGTAVGSWLPFQGEITIPPDAVSGYMQINFANTEGGTAWISDIVLLRKNAANLLVNAGVLQQYLAGNAVRLGTNVVRADNATAVTDATAITSLGTASGIAGQGAFATLNSAAYGSSLLSGFGALAPLANITFGSNFLLETAGTPATLAAFKTNQGTAASIAGQGALATKSSVASGDLGVGAVLPSRLGGLSGGNNVVGDPTFLDAGYWQLNGGGATVAFDTDATACTALGVQKAIKWTGDDATGTTTQYPGAPANRGQSFPCTGGENLVISFDYYVATAVPAGTGQLKLNLGVRRRDGSMQYFSAGVTTGGLAAGAKGVASQRAKLPDDAIAYSVYFEWQLQPNIARTGVVYAAAPFVGAANRLGFSLLREDGTTSITDALAITSLGTASGIAGQGAFATLNSAGYGSSLLTGFAALAAQPAVTFGSSFLLESAGVSATLARFRTADGTAASIAGQGAFATVNSAAYGSSLLTGFGGLAGDSLVKLGSTGKAYREDGTTRLTDATAVTSLGTASGIAGQGAFATLNSAAFGSGLLTGFGGLAGDSLVRLGSTGKAYREDGTTRLTDATAVTSLGTASGIAGQGALATASTINSDQQLGGTFVNRLSPFPGDNNYLRADRMAWSEGNTVQAFKPQEGGANVTENRTAAAFTGQGAFATLNSAAFGSSLLTGFGNIAGLGNIVFGDDYLLEAANTRATLPNFKTNQGTAAAIVGQGTGATASTLADLDTAAGNKLAGIQDRATYGDNLIPGAQTLDPALWQLSGDATRQVGVVGEPAFYFRMGHGARVAANNALHMPIKTPGSRHFIEVTARADATGGTRFMRVELNYKKADGKATYAGFATRVDGTFQIGTTAFALYRMYFDVPLDWVSVLVVLTSTQSVAGAYVDVGTVSLSASQAGSDSTDINPKMLSIDRASTRGDNLNRNADFRDLSPVTGLPSQVFSSTGSTVFVPPAGAATGYYENTSAAGGSDALYLNAGSPSPSSAFSTDWPIFETGQRVFVSAEIATSGARRVQLILRPWTAAGAGATTTAVIDLTADTAGAWVVRKGAAFTMPAGYVYLQAWVAIFTTTGTFTRVRNVRIARTEDAATLGADANTNIIDSGNAGVTLTRTQLVTSLGIAQAVNGQGPLATSTLTAGQVTNSAISISAAGVLSGAGGGTVTYAGVGGKALGLQDRIYYGQSFLYEESSFSTIATLANFKTSAGTAASIAGQGALATKNAADYGADVTGAGKPDTYRIMARGNAVSSPPPGFVPGLSRGDGSGVWTFYARSYSVVWYDRSAKVWAGRNFDVYGNSVDYGFGTGDANTGASAMATHMNNIPVGAPVVVYSSDEPRTNRMNGPLPAAMYRCGASRSRFGASTWRSHGAYILIGVAGAGEGNASAELYYDAGADGSNQSFQMASFTMVDGRIQAGARAINSADELQYSTGATVGSLRPGEAGANVTENRTASGIAGQGALATVNNISADSQLAGSIAARLQPFSGDANYLGAGRVAWMGGDTVEAYKPQDKGANVTENRTAAAITGQTAWATHPASTTRISRLQDDGYVEAGTVYDRGGMGFLYDVFPAQRGANVTGLNTASGIAGQGALATANTINSDQQLGGTFVNRLAPYPGDNNYLRASRLAWDEGGTVQGMKPGEGGANVTENRTAAAITGQAWAATNGSQDRADNQRVGVGGNGLVDTEFAQGNALWQPIWGGSAGAPAVQRGVNFAADANTKFYGANAVLWMLAAGTPTAGLATELAASGPSEDTRYFVPVRAGDNVYVAAYLAAHRCQGQVNVHWYNAAGAYLTENAWDGGRQDGGRNGDPANFDRIGGFVTAPANAAFACLRIRQKYNGGVGPYLFAMRPQITVCPAGQTVAPPYVPGVGDKRADRTAANTAAGFAGQGALATQSSLALGSGYLTGFGNLAGQGNIQFGDAFLLETAGVRATNANYKTISGTSAGISGQGSFATMSQVSMNSSQIVDRYASNLYYGYDGNNTGSVQSLRPGEANANVTENRTASAISGQGKFATASTIQRAELFQSGYFASNAFSLNYTITRSDGATTVTESMAITELGVASGFAGQGSLATKNTVSTGEIGANAVTAPSWMALEMGGSMGGYPQNAWADFDSANGGSSSGTGGGGGGGGGGVRPGTVNLQ